MFDVDNSHHVAGKDMCVDDDSCHLGLTRCAVHLAAVSEVVPGYRDLLHQLVLSKHHPSLWRDF
jgi:hypothetical protein